MQIKSKDFRVRPGTEMELREWPTHIAPVYRSEKHYQAILADHIARLSAQQELLYASNHHALLVIFQAMDAAGKDGGIKHVMSGVNPQGCQLPWRVFAFLADPLKELCAMHSDIQHTSAQRCRASLDCHFRKKNGEMVTYFLCQNFVLSITV